MRQAMNCSWFSRKGLCRADNRDYGGFLRKRNFILAIIVDASQKGQNGAGLAALIVNAVMDQASLVDNIDPHSVVEVLQVAHREARNDYLLETASYAISIHSSDGLGWAISCGDCRVGVVSDGKTEWISPVHSLANFKGEDFDGSHAQMPERHVLTRCWCSRRFERPDLVQFQLSGRSLCLATDGYWLEHEWLNHPRPGLLDDASCLTIGVSGKSDADCDNFRLCEI